MSRSSKAILLFVSAAVIPLCASQSVWADNVPETVDAKTAQTSGMVNMSGDLSTKTDTELTTLTAQWGNLNPRQRRQLLAEVRGRMVVNQQANQKIRRASRGIVVQRRYGRVVRKSDGSVVVETRVVQMTPRLSKRSSRGPVKGEIRARVTFGIGFEQRSKARPSPDASVPVPSVTVSQQQTQPTEP